MTISTESLNAEVKRLFRVARAARPTVEIVRLAFVEIIRKLSLTATDKSINEAFDRTLESYERSTGSGKRYYHTFDHVLDLMGWHYEDIFALSQSSEDFYVSFLAIKGHDRYYMTKANANNEANSAAEDVIELHELGVPPRIISRVVNEILATDHRQAHNSECFVRDYDLVGLADDWEKVAESSDLIRREYSHVSDLAFYQSRGDFFRGFANRAIFQSGFFQQTFTHAARANIDRIIAICDHEVKRHKNCPNSVTEN